MRSRVVPYEGLCENPRSLACPRAEKCQIYIYIYIQTPYIYIVYILELRNGRFWDVDNVNLGDGK